jgi:hypothetical protein
MLSPYKKTMRNIKKLLLGIFVISVITFSACEEEEKQKEEDINSSDFNEDANGWKIAGDAQGGSNIEASYSPFEGLDNSGYIYADDDVAGGVWYFVAPDKFMGDQSAFIGGKLSFYLIQKSALSDQFKSKDVIIKGGNNQEIYYYHESYPDTTWTHYEINLDTTAGWMNSSDTDANASEIHSVLSDVQSLWIRGEFESGPDTGGLDKFQFIEN